MTPRARSALRGLGFALRLWSVSLLVALGCWPLTAITAVPVFAIAIPMAVGASGGGAPGKVWSKRLEALGRFWRLLSLWPLSDGALARLARELGESPELAVFCRLGGWNPLALRARELPPCKPDLEGDPPDGGQAMELLGFGAAPERFAAHWRRSLGWGEALRSGRWRKKTARASGLTRLTEIKVTLLAGGEWDQAIERAAERMEAAWEGSQIEGATRGAPLEAPRASSAPRL